MYQFFHLHNEGRIGLKQLTAADLGFSGSSNQTHIGLSEGVLTYLADRDVVKYGLLVYGDTCSVCNCLFDRIANPDGSFRSPKIRKGVAGNSLVDVIRSIAANAERDDWYLMWAGLESGQVAFWLFESSSADYEQVMLANFGKRRVMASGDAGFEIAKELFEARLNQTSVDVQKEIEKAALTGKEVRMFRRTDLEKAKALFDEIGRKGEKLVAEYLEKQKSDGIISSFVWMNSNTESGNPFDFIIDKNLSTELYVDVKSTRFNFNQYLYFSDEEVKFINNLNNDESYSVYRVYDIGEEFRKMKICSGCLDKMTTTANLISSFEREMGEMNAIVQGVHIGFHPMDCFEQIATRIRM